MKNNVLADLTGEPVYVAIEPHHRVIAGPISLKVLSIALFIAFMFSSDASVFFAHLLDPLLYICVFVGMFSVFFILSLVSLGDYPDIPLIWINPKRKSRFMTVLCRVLAPTRVGFFSILESDPSFAVQKIANYLDARKKRQTAFLVVASEKAWLKHNDFILEFVKKIGIKFPSTRVGYLGTFTELGRVPSQICKVPFERIHGIKDFLWYLAEASIEANENGSILYELFSQSYCILYFTPRPFRGLEWKGKDAKFHPFTPETTIRWIEALVDRYCLVDGNFSFISSYVIFRLPYGDGIPLTSSIIQEVRKRMEVRPRVFHVSSPLSRVRKNVSQIILGGAGNQDGEVNKNVR